MFRVFGLDSVSAAPRHVDVDVSDERLAWKHAISKGIDPHDVVPLPETSAETVSREDVVSMIARGSHIKIGKSTNPHVRYAQWNTQLPEKPKLLHEIPTNNVDARRSLAAPH